MYEEIKKAIDEQVQQRTDDVMKILRIHVEQRVRNELLHEVTGAEFAIPEVVTAPDGSITPEDASSMLHQAMTPATATAPTNGKAKRRRVPKKKGAKPCIATGCSEPSKGPRFHYLCEAHRDAKDSDIERWQQEWRNSQG